MRHRRRGRTLGRKPPHQRAMLRNLASSLFLSEREDEVSESGIPWEAYPHYVSPNNPKEKGRVVTTLQKAKEVRPLVERCITIARKALKFEDAAVEFETTAKRGSEEWRQWRQSDQWQKWNQAIAPAVNARRRCLKLLGNKEAVSILFNEVADRYVDRDGGYTRIIRLATPRLGDGGTRAILELVGKHDRVRTVSERPAFEDDTEDESLGQDQAAAPDTPESQAGGEVGVEEDDPERQEQSAAGETATATQDEPADQAGESGEQDDEGKQPS